MAVFLQTDLIGFLILMGVGMVFGGVGYIAAERIADLRVDFIANVREEIGGIYTTVKRVRVGLTQETFTVGEAQFVKDEGRVSGREKWNRWGSNHPVMDYDIRDGRPMEKQIGKETDPPAQKGALPQNVEKKLVGGRPVFVKWIRNTKPSSQSTNLLFRRGGLKAMMAATRNVAMDPRVVGILCLVCGVAVGYLFVTLTSHPPSCIPSGGFYCQLTPIPKNVTVAH
jgi:hypothetical protein